MCRNNHPAQTSLQLDRNIRQFCKSEHSAKQHRFIGPAHNPVHNSAKKRNIRSLDEDTKSENKLLSKELNRLRDGIAKVGNGKVRKLLLDDDLWNDVVTWYKEGPFRNNKFFQNDKHRDDWVKRGWAAFKMSWKLEKAPHNLNLRKFQELYTKAVVEGQSKARQYIQSQAQNPCEGKSCLVLSLIRVLLPLTETNLTLRCLPLSLVRVVQQTRDLAYHRGAFGGHGIGW